MATLRKRKNKNGKSVWLLDFYYHGKRFIRSTKTDDFKVAKLILKEIEAKIAKNTFNVEGITPKKNIYMKQFMEEYLEYSRTHKAYKTFRCDRLTFKNFLRFVGNHTLNSIDHRTIDRYLNKRTGEVSKSSVNVELRHLKAAFSKAKQWGYINHNPFVGIKLFDVPQTIPIFFTREKLDKLTESIKEQWLQNIVVFAVNTGVRIGELVNIEWSDVDLPGRLIRIRHKADFTTKSKKERIIPMNDEVFGLLAQIERRGSYIFTKKGGGRRDTDFISKQFKSYVRKAGLGEQYTFHSLRHTFASHLVQQGVSLYIVSKLLGHSDMKTTEIYAHLVPETFLSVVNLLGSKKQQVTKGLYQHSFLKLSSGK